MLFGVFQNNNYVVHVYEAKFPMIYCKMWFIVI